MGDMPDVLIFTEHLFILLDLCEVCAKRKTKDGKGSDWWIARWRQLIAVMREAGIERVIPPKAKPGSLIDFIRKGKADV